MAKVVTARLDAETLYKIEYIKIWMLENMPIIKQWTTTDVIKLCITEKYARVKQ